MCPVTVAPKIHKNSENRNCLTRAPDVEDGGQEGELVRHYAVARVYGGEKDGRRQRAWGLTARGVRRWRSGFVPALADPAKGCTRRGIERVSGLNAGRI